MNRLDGRNRVVIERVSPAIDGGRFAIQRVVDEQVTVEADIFGDGHDVVSAVLQYHWGHDPWQESIMSSIHNDRWRGSFAVERIGVYRYTITAWINQFLTWHRDLLKRVEAGQVSEIDLLIGANLVTKAAQRAQGADREILHRLVERMRGGTDAGVVRELCDDASLIATVDRHNERQFATTLDRELVVRVDRQRAAFSAWYELFPRSCGFQADQHGTFRDVEARLPYIADLGFDILYLPPIHPIGSRFRKGKNGTIPAQADDVGSPWAIGSAAGGHKDLHPQLGSLLEFRHLIAAAEKVGIEIALDIAFQCSPDHPYVAQHAPWFRQRPDGTIQYAENPPKKYQDIYPFDYESKDWRALWEEMKSIFDFWIEQGIRVFRVDNPHTKPFDFWEWCIGTIRDKHPDVIFLAEAFTRPKVMYRLAKVGFNQSYTYFAWRNAKQDLTEYITELTTTEVSEYFRPNFWPNTPDILTEYLQTGGPPAFAIRFILAATLSANYGIYGPAFEHFWSRPREAGSEEYLDSEKYQLYVHDWAKVNSLCPIIARVNRIRRDFEPLQSNHRLALHSIDNDAMICFSKASADQSEIVLVIVNLDPHRAQAGMVDLPLDQLQIDESQPYQVDDLLGDLQYVWYGRRNFVQLDPALIPAHIFRIRRPVRS